MATEAVKGKVLMGAMDGLTKRCCQLLLLLAVQNHMANREAVVFFKSKFTTGNKYLMQVHTC